MFLPDHCSVSYRIKDAIRYELSNISLYHHETEQLSVHLLSGFIVAKINQENVLQLAWLL